MPRTDLARFKAWSDAIVEPFSMMVSPEREIECGRVCGGTIAAPARVLRWLHVAGSGTPGTVIMAGTLYYHYVDQRNFTADAAKDATSVTVTNAAGLMAGEIVSVTEQYDSNLTKYDHSAQLTGGALALAPAAAPSAVVPAALKTRK